MKRTMYIILIFLLAAVFFTTVSIAQVEEMAIGNTFGVGARTMGMGGASLALADDFTALYWNPAGMAQIQKFEFFSSFSHNTANTDAYFTGDEITGNLPLTDAPEFYGVRLSIPSETRRLGTRFRVQSRTELRLPDCDSGG